MSVSQRPAARFFAAFYRWNSQTQRARQCITSLQRQPNCLRHSAQDSVRKYHATSLLGQPSQSELQLQNEDEIPSHSHENSAMERLRRRPAATPGPPSTGKRTQELEKSRLKESVRNVLRKVPSSVAVITVESVDPTTKKNVPMGVAVSSLSSVTLDPPTISFNIKEPSQTLDAIRAASGRFRVHFLEADQGGARIVELFCRGNHPEAYTQRLQNLKIYVPMREEEQHATASNAPLIQEGSIHAALECTVTHEFPIADHIIIAASVDNLEQKTSTKSTMVYVDGKYMRPDTTITVHGNSQSPAKSDAK